MTSRDKMIDEIEQLASETFNEYPAILGLTVATHGGQAIYSKFSENIELTQSELAAATTSLLFLARNMFEKLLNQEIAYTITKGEKWLLLCLINKGVTGSVIFDRKMVELAGLSEHKAKMSELFFKLSAIVETSEIIKEDLFVQIKRAIPTALAIAIINKEGLPIKVQSTMEESKLSAFVYALYQLTNIILKKDTEYTIVGGQYGSIIILKIDVERILGIGVPESDDAKLGKYIAKLQEIIRNIK